MSRPIDPYGLPRETKCVRSGYRYVLTGSPQRWKTSKDDSWDIKVGKTMCGRVVGLRKIDGALVTVIKVRGKHYAATHTVDTRRRR